MKKLFGGITMGWKKVILFSIITGIYTAVVNLIPFLQDTSFQDIAINPEAWILFAMIIIMNCETRGEAVIKTFVFFLISQPLIYLIEAVFGPVGFGVFQYYKYWFIITLLTIPGAAIAFQVKKKGLLGALSLSVAVGFLGYMAVTYYRSLRLGFPNHLLSMIFCIVLAVTMIIMFIDELKLRLLSAIVLVAATVISLIVTKPILTYEIALPGGDWSYEAEDNGVVQIKKNQPDSFTVQALDGGTTLITFTNEKGETKEYYATVSGNGIYINEME